MSTYCFTDLHSNYEIWKQIKNYIKPTDTVYCLGDCIDRGKVGLNVLLEILNTHNITLLKGNHEDFLTTYGLYYLDNEKDMYNRAASLWFSNGGERSYEQFMRFCTEKQKNLIEIVDNLPTWAEYTNTQNQKIFMCHAGKNPKKIEHIKQHFGFIENNYLWDREHIQTKQWTGEINEYCVHGHTPVQTLKPQIDSKDPHILHYCENHKIDLDLGTFITNKACLLNLDTWEEIYFKKEDDDE